MEGVQNKEIKEIMNLQTQVFFRASDLPLAYEIALVFQYEGSSHLRALISGRMKGFLEVYVEIVEG